jgi:hypothetical protein
MILVCERCGSHDHRITAQSYSDAHAFGSYECGGCGATATTVDHDSHSETLVLNVTF